MTPKWTDIYGNKHPKYVVKFDRFNPETGNGTSRFYICDTKRQAVAADAWFTTKQQALDYIRDHHTEF